VPYIGDLAKTAKLPRYLQSVRKAIRVARRDFEWAHALRELFEKLKKVLDKGYELSADLLPDAARKQLKALKDEIDDFLKPRGSAAGNPPEGGIKTAPQSSKPIKSKGDLEKPQPLGNLDKNATKGHGGNENNVGPKTTTRLDSRHAEVSQGIAKRIGKSSPAQASGDIDQLFKQAKVADVELKKLTDDIARSTNGKAVYPPGLKTKARAIEKINADYGGDASKLLDISRSSISFDSADDLYKALDKIDKKAEIVRIKDRFVKPAPGGYRDILVNIKQPNGHITELQLHSKQILDVKGGTGHKLYEQIREINGKAILENRPLSASELRLQNSLIKESEALYDNAFKGFLGK
jgi:hypothetical protein